MDSDHFDALARSLSIPGTRRATLAAGVAGLTSLLGFASVGGKKKRKKKKKCTGDLDGQQCGKRCCKAVSQKCCDGKCIPSLSCCLPEGPVAHGGLYPQCGRCLNGMLQYDSDACLAIDPDGCTVCATAFQCVPGNDGKPCTSAGLCGTCDGGLCEGPGGGAPQTCCPAGTSECQFVGGGRSCCGPDTHCCSGTCCPSNGRNKCCPGKTGCWFLDATCP